jgi:signal peptidase II
MASGPGGRRSDPPEPAPHPKAVAIGLAVSAVLVLLDQVTKEVAETLLVPGRFVPWLGPNVGWQLIYNPGGAFGIAAPHWLFLIVTVGVVVLVARVLPKAPTKVAAIAYGMLLAGAIGNVLDRLLRPGGDGFGTGYVVDFVAWGSFPRFNVADSAITVGFVLLVLALLQEERRAASEQASADEASSSAALQEPGPGPEVAETGEPGEAGEAGEPGEHGEAGEHGEHGEAGERGGPGDSDDPEARA